MDLPQRPHVRPPKKHIPIQGTRRRISGSKEMAKGHKDLRPRELRAMVKCLAELIDSTYEHQCVNINECLSVYGVYIEFILQQLKNTNL